MVTCKYCGEQLFFIGEDENIVHFSCSFCDLVFALDDTSVDRKRKMSVPESYDASYNQSTKELLKRDTISLYHVLKDLRADWYKMKEILRNLKLITENDSVPQLNKEDEQTVRELKTEFIKLTKKKFSIENIIIERTGYIVEKITDKFLSEIVQLGKYASSKPMYIYIK
ncbi:hypothetical protein [Bacillus sp. 1P06AnD]|uniref:hypothetical protein n=1 Tax=Bacillus sp. 1P06AnD TaxID=3132208 RepID=UPI00399FED07